MVVYVCECIDKTTLFLGCPLPHVVKVFGMLAFSVQGAMGCLPQRIPRGLATWRVLNIDYVWISTLEGAE